MGSTDAPVEASLLETALMLISEHPCPGEVSPSLDVQMAPTYDYSSVLQGHPLEVGEVSA